MMATAKTSGMISSHALPLILARLVVTIFIVDFGSNQCTAQGSSSAEDLAGKQVEATEFFRAHAAPFIKTYCLDCHQNKRPTEAGLSFTPALDTPGHAAFFEKWKKAAARVRAHDMPPDGLEQPSEEERQHFLEWSQKVKYLSPKDPGPFVIRRLTKTEYANTLRDLFGVDPELAATLPDEVSGEGYLNSLSPLQLEQYLLVANRVLESVFTEDGTLREGEGRVVNSLTEYLANSPLGSLETTDPESASLTDNFDVEDFRQLVKLLAKKTYRRPASEEEVQVLLDVVELGKDSRLSRMDTIRLMLKAMLVSPQFLYITPAETTSGDKDIVPLDNYQLASRLSYFLWATVPDAELMALADAGRLAETKNLKAQVRRMLLDPRARALFDGFGAQWLGLSDLTKRVVDADKFPQMTPTLRLAMYDEVRLMFELIIHNNLSVDKLVDSDYTFVNEELASIYGLDGSVVGSQMRRTELANPNRGGILGMPGILTATSFPNRTSPVIRGVWVLEQVLGEQIPSAPPDVPALETQDSASIVGLTLRERTQLHRQDPVCANCHKLLDPIGFGLENFDPIGRWRDLDENRQPIDATGELPNGAKFASPADLKSMIVARIDEVARNLVEKLLAYALCRRLEGYDAIVVDDIMSEIAQDGYKMQDIIVAVVSSYPFTHCRIEKR